MHRQNMNFPQTREIAIDPARRFVLAAGAAAATLLALPGMTAAAGGDALAALRGALEKGADAAVSQLGAQGGFGTGSKWRIPLPDALQKGRKLLKLAGQGEALDQLEASMNQAAEQAVAGAKPLLAAAIRDMSVSDAQKIIQGGDDSVTRYFREKTQGELDAQFRPVVSRELQSLGVAQQYDAIAGHGAKAGLVKADAASLDGYVSGKAIDAVYALIAEQERAIRADPLSAGSEVVKRVFGSLR